MLFADGLHLFLHIVTPPGDGYVEGVVAAYLGVGPGLPLVVGIDQRLALLWYTVVNYCRWGKKRDKLLI